jgi:ankyrin repeat protein
VKLLQILLAAPSYSPALSQLTPAGILGAKDKEGRIPLLWAASNRQTKGLEVLLKEMIANGLDVNTQDDEKMTVLHWACLNMQAKHVAILIKSGANLRATDVEGKTALHWCTGGDDSSCAKVSRE